MGNSPYNNIIISNVTVCKIIFQIPTIGFTTQIFGVGLIILCCRITIRSYYNLLSIIPSY